MKRVLSLVLLLMLVLGCACADTKDDVRADLGVCSVEDYEKQEGVYYQWMEEASPFDVTSYIDGELTVWDVVWKPNGMEYWDLFAAHWFPARGVLAEQEYDLDADGENEWIVLSARDCICQYGDEGELEIWVSVYENGGGWTLADEVCMICMADTYGYFYNSFLTQCGDAPAVVIQHGIFVEYYQCWNSILTYNGEYLWLYGEDYGDSLDGGSDGMWSILEEPTEDMLEYASESVDMLDPDERKNYWDECWDEYTYEKEMLFVSESELGLKTLRSEELFIEQLEAVNNFKPLLLIKPEWYDEEKISHLHIERAVPGNAVTATASVNLRAEPGLDGEIVAAVEADTALPYLGEESTDDRGVVWYKVAHENQPCWVSSKYAALN